MGERADLLVLLELLELLLQLLFLRRLLLLLLPALALLPMQLPIRPELRHSVLDQLRHRSSVLLRNVPALEPIIAVVELCKVLPG